MDEQHGEQKSPKLARYLDLSLLGMALHSIDDPVITTDRDGLITFMNPATELLTGREAGEACGRPLESVVTIISEDTRLPVENPVARVVREDKWVRLGTRTLLISHDGTERPVKASATPIHDDHEGIAGVVLTLHDTTEQRQAEQKWQAALDYANNIIETLRHPFLVLDSELRVMSGNGAFYRNFHVSREETEGRRVYHLGNGQWNIPRLRSLLEEILPRNSCFEDFEVEHDFPIIGRCYMLLNARRIHRADEHADLILLGIDDISRRRQLEKERQEIETRFTSLVKNIKDHAIFAMDTEGHIASWNTEAERILGYTEAEVVGRNFAMIFTEEDIARGLPEEELRLAKEEGRAEDERWHKKKNGGLLWAFGIVTPTYDLEGNHTGFSKILRDVTDRKKMELSLQQSEAQFRAMFELTSVGVCQADPATGELLRVNEALAAMTGYSIDELVGRSFLEITHPDDRDFNRSGIRQLIEGHIQKYEIEKRFIRKDGTVFWGYVTANLVPEVDAQPRRTVALIFDVTNRRKAEEDLRKADRRKDEFLAMLSHELRNPLAPIMNAVQLIGQGGGDSEYDKTARRVIERQVRHLKRLVDDLLEVSRITTGKVRLQTARVALNEVVERAVERIRPMVEQHQQDLSLSAPEGFIWVQADAARLEQVFGNLLGNASKYNNVGGHIWVTMEPETDHAVVRVRDDGLGIAPELQPYVFDLFTQADKSLDRSEGGLGLGLALVKNLVEMHDGTVEVHSEGIGRGSEFVVRLPTARRSAGVCEAPPPQATQEDTKTLRILVVDDSVDVAKMSAMLLRSWGHEVRIAHNGPDALHRAIGFQPHVVLLDIGLPNMDGYEVARHIRQDPRISMARLVAITGYGHEEARQRSTEAGFDAHLVKPVEAASLKTLLGEISFIPPASAETVDRSSQE